MKRCSHSQVVFQFNEFKIRITYFPEVYPPSDDSFLLIDSLHHLFEEIYPVERRKELSVIELGTGTGIAGIFLLRTGVNHLLMTDISGKALKCARLNLKQNGVDANLICTSLFNGIKTKFDLVVFNPPYLPEEEREPDDLFTKALRGGREGYEIIQQFLNQLPFFLKKGGKAVIVLSSFNPVERLKKESRFSWRLLGKKHFFFERIYCYLLSERDSWSNSTQKH